MRSPWVYLLVPLTPFLAMLAVRAVRRVTWMSQWHLAYVLLLGCAFSLTR